MYQRKKGRDLFDLQLAISSGKLNASRVLECYQRYMEFVVESVPTYKQYLQNMELKMQDADFLSDMDILVREGATRFDPVAAYEHVKTTFIDRMPGKRE